MPTFKCTPVTMTVASTITYAAVSTGWIFGNLTLNNASGQVFPPQSLATSFAIGPVTAGPMGATAKVTFTGNVATWTPYFVGSAYSLIIMIAPGVGLPPQAATISLRPTVSSMLRMGVSAVAKRIGIPESFQARVAVSAKLARESVVAIVAGSRRGL